MLFTNHLLAGALLGRRVGRPAPALVLGVVSHAVMDAVPHWGKWDDVEMLRVARVDGILALGVAALTLQHSRPERRWATLAGMSGAGLPDMDKPGRHFFGRSPFPRSLDALHGRLQNEARSRWWVEVLAAAVLGYAVVRA